MGIPYIYSRTVASSSIPTVVEQGVAMSNALIVRQFGTSNWNKIRVGMRYRFMASSSAVSASFPTGTPKFFFGFCNGTTAVPGDQIVTQFLGGGWNDPVPAWTTKRDYVNINVAGYGLNESSASLEPTNNIHVADGQYFGVNYFIASNFTSSLDTVFIDIQKTGSASQPSSSYLVGGFQRSTTDNPREYYPLDAFVSDIQSLAPTRTGYVYTQLLSPFYLPLSFTSYPLNAVCVYWERDDPILEVTDMYVVRLS